MSESTHHGRRSFLRVTGAVLLAGVGLGAHATAAHAAPGTGRTRNPSGEEPSTSRASKTGAHAAQGSDAEAAQPCAIYCNISTCNFRAGIHEYRCTDRCGGGVTYDYRTGRCQAYCRRRGAC